MINVRFAKKAPFPRKIAKKACIREGLEFEAKAQLALDKLSLGEAFHSKWIAFDTDDGVRHMQPDSFYIDEPRLTIYLFEMKLRHTPRSAAQIAGYHELLLELYPNYRFKLFEVYKYWDWVVYPAESVKIEAEGVLGAEYGIINLVNL